jgi:hypothetical protein
MSFQQFFGFPAEQAEEKGIANILDCKELMENVLAKVTHK